MCGCSGKLIFKFNLLQTYKIVTFFRERITVLKSSLCLIVVTGVVLVVQPTFIFDDLEVSNVNVTKSPSTHFSPIQDTTFYLGIGIAVLCASSSGLLNVAAKKSKGTPHCLLLITAGLATLILAIPMFFSLKNTFLDQVSDIPIWKRFLLTMGVASASMIAGHLLVIANQVIRCIKLKL